MHSGRKPAGRPSVRVFGKLPEALKFARWQSVDVPVFQFFRISVFQLFPFPLPFGSFPAYIPALTFSPDQLI
jgi:hypothetical protein